MAEVTINVDGRAYSGWTRVRVTLGIEAICGGFELSITDRWNGQNTAWPIVEEDECTLAIGGQTVITGFVDQRRMSYSAKDHSLEVTGRDQAGMLVDCSAVLDKWEFKNLALVDLATALCKPFGISVTLDETSTPPPVTLKTKKNAGRVISGGSAGKRSGLKQPKPPKKFSVNPGDSAFEVLDRACRMAGLIPISDGQGNITLTRAGSVRCDTPLVEGENVLSASADFNVSQRYSQYIVTGQHPGSNDWSGKAVASVRGTASDDNIKRTARALMIRAETAITPDAAQVRAAWESTVRAARGDTVKIVVQGWLTNAGKLWPVNSLVRVSSPMIAVDGEMLITQTVFTLDNGGTTTELTLRRPDAYLPEPSVSTDGTTAWKEASKQVSGNAPVQP